MATPNRSQLSPHAVIGVFVALLGVLFTLDNLHLLQVDHLLRYWPIAPIGVGLLVLVQADSPGEWWKGSFWLAAGGLFMARSLGYLPFSPWDLWPLFMVMVGVKMIWNAKHGPNCEAPWGRGRRMERMARQRDKWARRMQQYGHDVQNWPPGGFGGGKWPGAGGTAGTGDWKDDPHTSFAPGSTPDVEPPPLPNQDPLGLHDDDPDSTYAGAASGLGEEQRVGGPTRRYPETESRITMFALMSGVKRKFAGLFRGAQLTAIMGGIELDLRGARVEDVAVIDALAFWGGIDIFVPEDWAVVNQGHALMGGFDDSTRHPDPGERPRLIVRGLALMGGVEIKVKARDNWWKGKS